MEAVRRIGSIFFILGQLHFQFDLLLEQLFLRGYVCVIFLLQRGRLGLLQRVFFPCRNLVAQRLGSALDFARLLVDQPAELGHGFAQLGQHRVPLVAALCRASARGFDLFEHVHQRACLRRRGC